MAAVLFRCSATATMVSIHSLRNFKSDAKFSRFHLISCIFSFPVKISFFVSLEPTLKFHPQSGTSAILLQEPKAIYFPTPHLAVRISSKAEEHLIFIVDFMLYA